MRALYLLALLFLTFTVFAQKKGAISGTVTSAEGSPAEYVNISIKGTTKGAIADRKGRYLISGVTPGSYTIVASFVGLGSQEKTIEVVSDQTVVVDFSLTETSEQLNEIIVSANKSGYKISEPSPSLRLAAPLLETPQNIQVITNDVIRDQQIISMSDGVIRNISGAYRSEHWADMYTNIHARGSQVQAFRNGFNAVNSYWGPLTEDMSFVDHIEFVKGPAGFMLSNGDPSGLYNVVTKKPTGRNQGEVAFTVGSFDLYRTSLDLDGKLSKDGRLLYRLNLAAQNKKSHRPNEYNDRYVIAPVISYQLNDNTKLTAEYTYQRANMSNVGSYYVWDPKGLGTLPVDYTMMPVGLPGSEVDDHSVFVNLQHKISDSWKLTAQVARFDYSALGSSAWPSSVSPDGKVIRGIGFWQAEAKMSMAQVFINGEINTGSIKHRILGGLDLANKEYIADWGQNHELDIDTAGSEFDIYNPYNGVPITGYPKFDYSTPLSERALALGANIDQRYFSGYLQDELVFFDNRLRLTLAGRYTYVKQAYGPTPQDGNLITPRIGISGSINKFTTVYALYDQAFQPQAGLLENGDPVKPLTGSNVELGVKKDWLDGKWNTTLALYRIYKNNEAVALTNDPTNPRYSEIGQKQSQGIEFDVRGTVLPGLNLTANYAFTDSKVTETTNASQITEGQIVPGFAKHTANAWLSYSLSNGVLKGLGISGGFTLLSGRETYWTPSPDPDQNLPTYFKSDGGIFWGNNNLRIALNIFNILDDKLYSGSYDDWLKAYYTQTEAPRNAKLSVNYKF